MAEKELSPLRLVVNEHASQTISGVEVEAVELACGHKLAPPSDYIGRRYPERMRCWKCRKGEPSNA